MDGWMGGWMYVCYGCMYGYTSLYVIYILVVATYVNDNIIQYQYHKSRPW